MANTLIKAIKIGVVLALFTPLIMGPLGLTMSSYPKAFFFRIIIEIIFVLYILLFFLKNEYAPKISLVSFGTILFSAILLLTSITGINFNRSFFGDPERAEGVILNIHFLAFFIIITAIYRKKEDWINLLRIIISVGGISSLIALLQKLNVWHFYGINYPDRVSGTISNPDFFSSYIVLNIFLTIFLIFSEKAKDIKFVWSGILILDSIALLLSQSRGSWAALFIASLLLIPIVYKLYLKFPYKKKIILLFSILILCILLLFVIFLFKDTGLYKNRIFWRFYSIFEFSLGSRGDVWKIGLDAFLKKPIFGWGPETFSFIYDSYFKAEYLEYIPKELFFDHPHNKILDIMVSSGMLGVIVYLFITLYVFYILYKKKDSWNGFNNIPGFVYNIIIAAFWVSFHFQSLFYFDTICTYLLFFFILAFVNNNFSIPQRQIAHNIPKHIKIIFIPIILVVSIITVYEINIKPTYASIHFPIYAKYEASNPDKAIEGYKNALNNNTIFDKDFRVIAAERAIYILEKGYLKDDEGKIIEFLISLKPYIKQDIENTDRKINSAYETLAKIDERIYIFSKDKEALIDMGNILNKAVEFNNQRPEFYLLMGDLKILNSEYQEGEEYFRYMNSLYPNTYENKMLMYRLIGAAYYKAEDYEKAAENFKRSLLIGYYYKKFSNKLGMEDYIKFAEGTAVIYCRYLNNIESCKDIYEKTIEIFPDYKISLQSHLKILLEEHNN